MIRYEMCSVSVSCVFKWLNCPVHCVIPYTPGTKYEWCQLMSVLDSHLKVTSHDRYFYGRAINDDMQVELDTTCVVHGQHGSQLKLVSSI